MGEATPMTLTMTTLGSDQSTTGTLVAGAQSFYTIEPPWLDDAPFTSCVPGGTYDLIPYDSPVHGPTWCLHNPDLNVWGMPDPPAGMRTRVEIHSGNVVEDSEACILLGLTAGELSGETAVLQSVAAITDLRAILTPMSSGNILQIKRL